MPLPDGVFAYLDFSNKNDYYVGIWYVEIPKEGSKYEEGGSYMATALKTEDGQWKMRVRIRWYKPEGRDDFSGWEVGVKDDASMSEAQITEDATQMARTFAAFVGPSARVEFMAIRGGNAEFLAEWERIRPPWLKLGGMLEER